MAGFQKNAGYTIRNLTLILQHPILDFPGCAFCSVYWYQKAAETRRKGKQQCVLTATKEMSVVLSLHPHSPLGEKVTSTALSLCVRYGSASEAIFIAAVVYLLDKVMNRNGWG